MEVVRLLIARGCQVHAQYNTGQTPLHLASYFQHKEVIKYLVSKGASLTIQDNDGINSLDTISSQFGLTFINEIT